MKAEPVDGCQNEDKKVKVFLTLLYMTKSEFTS